MGNSSYLNFLAGGLSGILEVSTSHPLDVVKTAMQDKVSTNRVKMSPYHYLVDRYKRGGFRHLYRGYMPRVLGVIPMRAMFWGAQSTAYDHLIPYDMSLRTRASLAGMAGGIAQTVIDNPIEVMKTRMITSSHMESDASQKTRVSSTRLPNTRLSRFPGFGPTLLRNVGFMVVLTQVTASYDGDSYLTRFVLGGTGGFIGSVVTQPIDYVKTKMQSANHDGRSGIQIFSETFRKNPRALMVGLVPKASLGFLNMSVGYLGFSLFIKLFDK
jgi:hypothetical protein